MASIQARRVKPFCTGTVRATGSVVSALLFALLGSCGTSVMEPGGSGNEQIVMSVRGLTLGVADTTAIGLYWVVNNSVSEQTAATGGPANWTFEPQTRLSSSDTGVAYFASGGVVVANRAGFAWLYATRGSSRDSSRVTVVGAPESATGIVKIAVGPGHACALDATGQAWCWGGLWNAAPGLGYRARYSRLASPGRVKIEERFVDIDVGTDHSCAVASVGSVYCWGDNRFGQVGTPAPLEVSPVRVIGVERAREISVGGDNACVLRDDGTIQCWGSAYQRAKVFSSGSSEAFVSVSVGSRHVCARSVSRILWCWGSNSYGQLGTGDVQARAAPVRIDLGTTIAQVSAGSDFTCAIDDEGFAWCWGLGLLGELGQGDVSQRVLPARVATSTRFSDIAAGGGHTCALDQLGRAMCWGGNLYGALGIGPVQKIDPMAVDFMFRTPVSVVTDNKYSRLAAGGGSTCAISSAQSRLDCWGANLSGQLGIGHVSWSAGKRYSTRTTPVQVVGFKP